MTQGLYERVQTLSTPPWPLVIRSLTRGDEQNLLRFASLLGTRTRALFAPYAWGAQTQELDYQNAVQRSEARQDASFLAYSPSGDPIAHPVLWGINRVHLFENNPLHVPTLGICVADQFQGMGIGRLCVEFLQSVGNYIGVDALELTVAFENERARRLYGLCGFVGIGELRIPLGVNPSKLESVADPATVWRNELHMMYPINLSTSHIAKRYLQSKQKGCT